ncbi:MAG: TlpA family protein disulfide reductase [Planctomycetia bacterium]|nr:TlpA family protein disulfide reductase [Planctomycetia bacterium]
MNRLLTLALMSLMLCTLHARAADLNVGDSAPDFAVNKFLKGEPVKQLQQGQIYVIEFWATWCGPCIDNIPKLTAMQKKYGDKVVFVGVSVFERDQTKVAPFVKQMGSKMNYRVAMDKVEKNGKSSDGHMAKNWLKAAGQNGIPCAFIVDKEGKIAWIGHPAQMAKPLDNVVAGLPAVK